jgi:hypothetical protein
MDIDRSFWRPPIVAATATARSGDGIWTVEIDCPYCPASHRHGGGSEDKPELRGHRVQHCKDLFYRQRKIYDASAAEHMPGYILAPADSAVDWQAERDLASAMLEEVEMALDEVAERDAWNETRVSRTLAERLEKAAERAEQAAPRPKRKSKSQDNAEYLAAWKAKRAWMEAGG